MKKEEVMKQLKRGLAFLLVLVMVMGSMGTGVMAAPTAKTGKKAAVKKLLVHHKIKK